MERVTPWEILAKLEMPQVPEIRKDRSLFSLNAILRIHFMWKYFAAPNLAMVKALNNVLLVLEFTSLFQKNRLSDGSTMLKFRPLPQNRELTGYIVAMVNSLLRRQERVLFADADY